MSYITNYSFVVEKDNTVCDDADAIASYQLNDFDVIKMVPCLYSKSTAKIHVEVLKYILYENPPFVNKFIEKSHVIYKDVETLISNAKEDNEKAKQYIKEYIQEMTDKKGTNKEDGEENETDVKDNKEGILKTEGEKQEVNKSTSTTVTDSQPKTDTKESKEQEDKSKVDPKATAKPTTTNVQEKSEAERREAEERLKKEFIEEMEVGIRNIREVKEKVMNIDFKRYSMQNLQSSNLYEDQAKPLKFKCLESLNYSHYNHMIDSMDKESGFLVFLVVQTLEGQTYHITGTERGFYVNSSTFQIFNPQPIQPLQSSYTLVGLLCLISNQFKENFTKLMTQVLTVDPIYFLPTPNNRFDWLKAQENEHFYNYIHKFGENISELHAGKKPSREWNEELQAVFDLKIPSNMENLQKEKLLTSLYNSFKESAIEVFFI